MPRPKAKKIITIIVFLLLVLGAVLFFNRVKIKSWVQELTRESVPVPVGIEEFESEDNADYARVLPNALSLDEASLPDEFNLDVPFTSQAPFAEWDLTHEEACEEASVLMVHYFYQNKKFAGPQEADDEILKFIEFETGFLGFFESTTADELARVVEAYWGYDIDLIYDFSVDNVKRAIYNGHPVVLPAAGRVLDNPNFQEPGPVYHMLVIKGWKGDKFITNDPGTRNGEDWLYAYDHLMNSAHDWNGGDVEQGSKVMLIMK